MTGRDAFLGFLAGAACTIMVAMLISKPAEPPTIITTDMTDIQRAIGLLSSFAGRRLGGSPDVMVSIFASGDVIITLHTPDGMMLQGLGDSLPVAYNHISDELYGLRIKNMSHPGDAK